MACAANAAQLVSALLSDAAIEAPPLAPASSQLQLLAENKNAGPQGPGVFYLVAGARFVR